jgi:hypothetical protein
MVYRINLNLRTRLSGVLEPSVMLWGRSVGSSQITKRFLSVPLLWELSQGQSFWLPRLAELHLAC